MSGVGVEPAEEGIQVDKWLDEPGPAVPDPTGTARPAPLSRRGRRLLFLGAALAFAPLLLHSTALVDRIPPLHSLIAGTLGFAAGLYLAARIEARRGIRSARDLIGLLGIPLLAIPVATYYARLATEAAAFAGAARQAIVVTAPVTSMSRRGFFDRAYVRPDPQARELQVNVSADLSARLDPYRAPGRDCLRLDGEVGRGGTRRVRVPRVLGSGLGVERLVPCAGR